MTPAERAKSVFCAAIEIESDAEREDCLRRHCGGDKALRDAVDRLIAAHDRAGVFESAAGGLSASEQPGTRLGPYTLRRRIGEGGMGAVYLASQDEPVSREVALKIIRPGMDSRSVIQRFESERQALAVLNHPNIAKVFDAGATSEGRPYFVMEYVDGVPITEFCDRRQLGIEARIGVFLQVCQAVQHAHQKGIIHRDLKPANILVAEFDGVPTPKIIDFGVAKAADPDARGSVHTVEGQILGTPEYMSPEQASLEAVDVDTRSDIYSLGVVLYELLCGSTPFDRDRLGVAGITGLLQIIREQDPELPSRRVAQADATETIAASRGIPAAELAGHLARELDWIVMRALEKDRGRRYENASALAADLDRFLVDEPVLACPPSRSYRIRKFVRRHQGPVAAASGMAVLLLLGFAGTSIGFWSARDAERVARDAQDLERRQRFLLARDRGLASCAEGRVGSGVLWLVRALELCPDDEPDSERMVRANLRAWSTELHSLRMVYPHRDAVISVAISPDGELLATGSNDDTARIWRMQSGKAVGPALRHRGDVHELEFSADSRWLLSSDYRTTAFLWDVAEGRRLRTFHHGAHRSHDPATQPCPEDCGAGVTEATCAGVAGAAFRPGARGQFVTTCGDGSVRLWHAGRGIKLHDFAGVHRAFVHDVSFRADGRRMVTACHDRKTRIWDVERRQVIATIQHASRVPTADFFGPDGDLVVTGDGDGRIYVWSVARALAHPDRCLRESRREYEIGPFQHRGVIHRIRASASGDRFLSASYDNTASLWIRRGRRMLRRQLEVRAAVQGVAFERAGPHIAFGCDDNLARLVLPAAGQECDEVQHGSHPSQGDIFSRGGEFVLVRMSRDDVAVVDSLSRRVLVRVRHPDQVTSLAVSPARRLVAIGSTRNTCSVYSVSSGEPSHREPIRHESGVWTVEFSPDGRRLLTGSYAGTVRLHDAVSGRSLGEPMRRVARIHGVAFHPDGRAFAVASADKIVRIFRSEDLTKCLEMRGHRSAAVAVVFSTDGRLLASGGHDNTLRIWDAHTGAAVGRPMQLRGPIWFPTNLAFSGNGRLLVCGGDDGEAWVWDVATGLPLGPPLVHDSGIRMVAFRGDDRVLTGTTLGLVRTWRLRGAPIPGSLQRVRLWAEVETGLQLDADGVVQPLGAAGWRRARAELAALGGPPLPR